MNIELLVIEQLFLVGEKELAFLTASAPIREMKALEEVEEPPKQPSRKHLRRQQTREDDESLVIWLPQSVGLASLPSSGGPSLIGRHPAGRVAPREERDMGGLTTASLIDLQSVAWRMEPPIDSMTKTQLLLSGHAQPVDRTRFTPAGLPPISFTRLSPRHQSQQTIDDELGISSLEIISGVPSLPDQNGVVIPLNSIVRMLEREAKYQAKLEGLDEYQISLLSDLAFATSTTVRKERERETRRQREAAQQSFETQFDILFLPTESVFSHWLIFPMPRYVVVNLSSLVYYFFSLFSQMGRVKRFSSCLHPTTSYRKVFPHHFLSYI